MPEQKSEDEHHHVDQMKAAIIKDALKGKPRHQFKTHAHNGQQAPYTRIFVHTESERMSQRGIMEHLVVGACIASHDSGWRLQEIVGKIRLVKSAEVSVSIQVWITKSGYRTVTLIGNQHRWLLGSLAEGQVAHVLLKSCCCSSCFL